MRNDNEEMKAPEDAKTAELLREIDSIVTTPIAKALLTRCRASIESLARERDRLSTEQEILAWNLGCCATLALGYHINDEPAADRARPALFDVQRMARENASLRDKLAERPESIVYHPCAEHIREPYTISVFVAAPAYRMVCPICERTGHQSAQAAEDRK